ncbi:hypothetical protein Tco_0465690 [Tanacetum coccineum]
MSNFKDSSFHNNNGRRMMSPKMKDYYSWEELKSSNVDVCQAFLKLCIVEDPIWEKITYELEEPFCNFRRMSSKKFGMNYDNMNVDPYTNEHELEVQGTIYIPDLMIEEKINGTKGVRLRGLEERKERKECLQKVQGIFLEYSKLREKGWMLWEEEVKFEFQICLAYVRNGDRDKDGV